MKVKLIKDGAITYVLQNHQMVPAEEWSKHTGSFRTIEILFLTYKEEKGNHEIVVAIRKRHNFSLYTRKKEDAIYDLPKGMNSQQFIERLKKRLRGERTQLDLTTIKERRYYLDNWVAQLLGEPTGSEKAYRSFQWVTVKGGNRFRESLQVTTSLKKCVEEINTVLKPVGYYECELTESQPSLLFGLGVDYNHVGSTKMFYKQYIQISHSRCGNSLKKDKAEQLKRILPETIFVWEIPQDLDIISNWHWPETPPPEGKKYYRGTISTAITSLSEAKELEMYLKVIFYTFLTKKDRKVVRKKYPEWETIYNLYNLGS